MIEIGEKAYIRLRNAEALLNAIERAGVDNWDGIDYAFEDYDEETVTDEVENQISSGTAFPEDLN